MYLDFCVRQEPAPWEGITLDTIFYIDGDASYSIPEKRTTTGKTYVIFTLRGEGEISYDRRSFRTGGGTLLYMQPSGSLSYRCLGEKWEFWWFEFMGESTFPPNQLASFPVDQLALSLMEGSLQYAKQGDWVLASSLFRSLHLLACRNANRSPRSVREEQIIRTMEEYIRENLSTVTVGDLCAVFNIQERTLRNIFVRTISLTPKELIMKIKLEYGGRLLLHTANPLDQIAVQSGFADRYHFSKAFKAQYGVSPIQYRRYIHMW